MTGVDDVSRRALDRHYVTVRWALGAIGVTEPKPLPPYSIAQVRHAQHIVEALNRSGGYRDAEGRRCLCTTLDDRLMARLAEELAARDGRGESASAAVEGSVER